MQVFSFALTMHISQGTIFCWMLPFIVSFYIMDLFWSAQALWAQNKDVSNSVAPNSKTKKLGEKQFQNLFLNASWQNTKF